MAAIARHVRVTLERRTRPRRGRPALRRRTVVVESLSIERLLALLQIGFARVSRLALSSKEPITGYQWVTKFSREEQQQIVRLACPAEQPRFFREWAGKANMLRIVGAMFDTNDVPGILAALNLSGKPHPGSGGNIFADVAALCRIYPGATPPAVMGWYADQFFEACAGLRELERIRNEHPAGPPSMERSPAEAFIGIPGVEVVQ